MGLLLCLCLAHAVALASGCMAGGENGVTQGSRPGGSLSAVRHLPTAVDPEACVQTPTCDPAPKYRRIDGSCNNRKIPTWGMTGTPYARLLKSDYSDGHHAIRKATDGSALPNTRDLRTRLLPIANKFEKKLTHFAMQFSQLTAHDTVLGMRVSSVKNVSCCNDTGEPVESNDCADVSVKNDEFYRKKGRTCLAIVRVRDTYSSGCVQGAGEPINQINHFLDCSFVYGNTDEQATDLRAGSGGLLRVQENQDRELLPTLDNLPEDTCHLLENETLCYKAGDPRVNQTPMLSTLQTVFLRAHNRYARDLAKINPCWDDEKLYQEARRILIAQFQHIVYGELLPIVIGESYARVRQLLPTRSGYATGYDEDLNPASLNTFAGSVWRTLHTLIFGLPAIVDSSRNIRQQFELGSYMRDPTIIQEERSNYDGILRGLTFQSATEFDVYFDEQVVNFLLRFGKSYGDDLITVDIMRNRDYGMPGYNAFRELIGLPRARTFEQFADVMDPEQVRKLKEAYRHPDDVDMTLGCLSERIMPNALVGPTLRVIIAEQFYRWKFGDRCFYEFKECDYPLTKEQLDAIKKIKISRFICDYSDQITKIQPQGFYKVSRENPLVSCNSSAVPTIDLSAWKDKCIQ